MVANDNLGILMAGIFKPVNSNDKSVFGIIDISGVSHEMKMYGRPLSSNMFNENSGTFAQVGKGASTPTRQDFNIENPFTNGGVEDSRQNTNLFGYNSGLGLITIGTQISPTTGSGTIKEVCKFHNFLSNTTGTVLVFLIYRDLISDVTFVASESIDLSHEVLI